MADWFTENAPDAPTAKTPPSVQPNLDLISKYESGDRNVPNYRFDPGHTAQGYYQITNTNWNQIAPRVGIDTATYPNAMSAPRDVQAKVAGYLLTQTPAGIHNWSDFNPQLRAALSATPDRGESDRAVIETPSPVQPAPSPVQPTAAQAANGIDDILARIGRGENVNVTPEMIMQVAFGDTGKTAPAVLPPPPAAAPVQPGDWFATNAPKPPPPPPQQPPALERAWNAFTGSSGLQTLGGLSSGFPALAGRISGMPDYANEQRFKNTVSGLYQGIVGEPARISSELQKSGEALLKGDINAAADHIWFAIPYLGAVGAQMKEYLDRGDVAGALGHAAGALGTAAIVTPEGRAAVAEAPGAVTDAVAEAAPKVGAAVKGAVQGAAEAATEKVPFRKFGVNLSVYKPIVTGTAGGAAAGAVGIPHPVGAIIGAAAPIIKGAVRGAREALAGGAPEAEAAAAAPEAAAAATPGQAYAAAQGVDWGSLSATDRQAMEQIARAHANMAQAAQSPRVMPSAEAAQVFPDVGFGESPAPPAAPPLTPQDLSELTTGRPPSRQSEAAQQTAAETLATAQSAEAATSAAPTFLQTVLDRTRGFLTRIPGISFGDLQGILDRVRSRLSAQPELEEIAAPRPAGRPPGPPGPPGQVMSRAQRRATVMPPEEGIPEQVARAQAEREAIIGKPRDQWTNADVLAADALRAEGYTGGPQPTSAPPAAGPAMPPALPPPVTPPAVPSTTGLAEAGGGMADAITANMYDALWKKVLAGDITEGGQPSAVLQAARMVRKNGGLQTPESFRAFVADYTQVPRGPQFQAAMRDLVAKHSPPPPATEPVPAPTSPPVAPEPPATAPATPSPPEAPAGAVTRKLAEFLKASELTPEDIDKFDAHDWQLIGEGVGGAAPTPEQIGEIRASVAGAAAPVPPEVAKMPPAQAEAAVAPKLRKPPASVPKTAAPPPAPTPAPPRSLAEMMAGIPERPELEKLDFAAVTRARNVERLYDTMREAGITPEMADAEGDAGWTALAKKAKIGPKGKPYVPSQTTRAQLRQRFAQ